MFDALYSRYRQKISTRASLYGQPIPTTEAIRWMERAVIDQVGKVGLFMHPHAEATFRVAIPPRSMLEAHVGLLPQIWEKNTGGVVFSIRIEAPDTQPIEWKRFIHPHQLEADRQWIPVEIDLHTVAGKTAQIMFSTTVLAGATTEYAWAVWGSPALRSTLSVQQMLEKIQRHVRTSGVMQTLVNALRQPTNAEIGMDPYSLWQQKNTRTAQNEKRIREEIATRLLSRPLISILTPVYNTDPRWLRDCIESVRSQLYPRWQLCLVDDASTAEETRKVLQEYEGVDERIHIEYAAINAGNAGIAATTNRALAHATGSYIALLDHDDTLAPDALYEVAKCLQEHPDTDMLYSDEDKLELDGSRVEPFFKPDWSPEYFHSCMYTSHLSVYRKSIVDAIGGFRSAYDKAQDYDVALRFIERTAPERIRHIPKILYHWRKIPGSTAVVLTEKDMSDQPATRALQDYVKRNHLVAEVIVDPVTTYHRMKYRIVGEPLVSILLPTNGKDAPLADGRHVNLLLQCLKSIEEKTTYRNYEIVIGHNGNLAPEVMRELQAQATCKGNYTIVHYVYEEPFNFAHKLNFIAKHANPDAAYFLILNDDIEVLSPEWVSAMLEYAQQKEIGVVGAKLYYPNGTIQHAGVVMGIGGGASHVFTKQPHDDAGYFASTKVIRNFSVVTGACAMTKRSLFQELGGLNEQYRIDYNDVDYCLRARAKGYCVVFTPYAELTHHESITIGSRAGQTQRPEERLLRTQWADVIAHDPYYNPNLTLTDTNYGIRL